MDPLLELLQPELLTKVRSKSFSQILHDKEESLPYEHPSVTQCKIANRKIFGGD